VAGLVGLYFGPLFNQKPKCHAKNSQTEISLSLSLSLLLMGACTQGLVDGPTASGAEGFKPTRGGGVPTADLPSREELLQSSKYLEFPNFDAFTKAVVAATQAEPARQFAWEKSQDFVSLKRMLEREIDNFAANEAPKFANPTAEQAKEAEANIQAGLRAYRGFITYSNQEAFALAVSPSAFGHLLNRDGVVKIGPDLYQFTADRMKVIRGGDEAKIPELFGAAASDPVRGIEVTDIRVGGDLAQGRTENLVKSNSNSGTNAEDGRKLTMSNQLYFVNGQYQYWVVWRAQVKVFFGSWRNDRVDISGNGHWDIAWNRYFWTRTTLYRHTHEELVCTGCNIQSADCPGGPCFTSWTRGNNETWDFFVEVSLN
jgi:hypothetical protein